MPKGWAYTNAKAFHNRRMENQMKHYTTKEYMCLNLTITMPKKKLDFGTHLWIDVMINGYTYSCFETSSGWFATHEDGMGDDIPENDKMAESLGELIKILMKIS